MSTQEERQTWMTTKTKLTLQQIKALGWESLASFLYDREEKKGTIRLRLSEAKLLGIT